MSEIRLSTARAMARLLGILSLSCVLIAAAASRGFAQSASAALTGTVVDSTGAVLSGATVTAVQEGTSARRDTRSASDGGYSFPTLPPGRYIVATSLKGFKSKEVRDVVLNVGDRLVLRLELVVGDMDESVTVVSEARINTSPGVGTVIDRTFVANLPLNGRSFQALLELTPGVVMTPSNNFDAGAFSVNGQRTTGNYFMIDGVSANAAAPTNGSGFLGPAGSGQLPALTAQGGTNGLVSVDALQEFRLQTSGYAPEFGRVPGGQISIVTRSGTNVVHGSAFEYFRHDALDANDWFVKRAGQDEAKLRQHNFGGVLGGPIRRDRTFAFGSYEGLRLLLPQARTAAVPTQAAREGTVAALKPYIDALPLPNGAALTPGYAQFLAVYSDPSDLDSTSVRIDHNQSRFRLFGRVSDAPSSSSSRPTTYGSKITTHARTTTGTAGITWIPSPRFVNDLRVNVTETNSPVVSEQAPIGGATRWSPVLQSGRDPSQTSLIFQLSQGGSTRWGPLVDSPTRQINLVQSLAWSAWSHEVKFGVDFRRLDTTTSGGGGTEIVITDLAGLRTGNLTNFALNYYDAGDRSIRFNNLSVYAQDQWRPTARLTLSYGVRWELVPPPSITDGVAARTLDRTDQLTAGPASLTPPGTELWHATHTNFAPRVGVSYLFFGNSNRPLVLKSGIGRFYDLGYGQIANAAGWSYPFVVTQAYTNVVIPVAPALVVPPVFGVNPPTQLYVMDRNLLLPYTTQWNVTAEQALGQRQSVTIGWLGSDGHRLLRLDRYQVALREWPGAAATVVNVSRNLGRSDYRALQVQFQRRLSQGLQAIASYTLARSRDTGSSDATVNVPAERLPPELDYGYSNFDVRHVFSGALTYQLPELWGTSIWRAIAKDWGVDLMIRARSGFPIELTTSIPFPPATGSVRPNVVPGQPFWLQDDAAPGGRRLNRSAFAIPAAATQGDLARGSIRGLGLSQVDLAIRRDFALAGRFRVQIRVEAFNLLNTPNFGPPNTTLSSADFGLSTQMLGRSLGGQNVLYQVGGPRSLQLATKLVF